MAENVNEENETKNHKLVVQKERESVSALEKLNAQSDQLLLQEMEIQSLKEELQTSKQTNVSLNTHHSIELKTLRDELLCYVNKCRQLEDNKRELEENICLYKDRNKDLHINYQKLQSKCLELEEDLRLADKQNDRIESIKKDNSNLKTQVLLLTELYQGLKDRFAVINKNATIDEINVIESEARNRELKDLKIKLDSTVNQMEALKMKNNEIESQIVKKDNIVAELKNIIENNKLLHFKQIQVEQQRISSLKNVIQNLEIHILSLYGQLGLRQHEERLRQKLDIKEEYDSYRSDDNDSNHNSNGSNSIGDNHCFTNGNHN